MKKNRGFYVTRKREERRRLCSPPAWFWPAALLAALALISGATRAWPQSSGSSSSSSSGSSLNSDNYLRTWDQFSQRFTTGLDEQSARLQQALEETQTSKASSEKLTPLLERSLQTNESLRSSNADLRKYNAQIGERMQKRDEDLAAAYGDIARLEKQNLKLIIALIIAIVAAVAATLLFVLLLIRR